MTRIYPANLIERAAKDHGDRLALQELSGKQVSYAELFRLAERVRCELFRRGVRAGDRVAIGLPKSIAAVAALHGTLRCGAVSVPLDPSAPPARNALIVAHCEARAAIVDQTQWAAISAGLTELGSSLPVPLIDPLAPPVESQYKPTASTDRPDALAYLLYTSGSTGQPKGVMLSQENIASFVEWSSRTFEPLARDRFSSHAPLHFDLSIFDLFVSALHGASVVLIDEQSGKQPETLAHLIRAQAISIWYSVPSVLALITQYAPVGWQPPESLRSILFAGEVFPLPALRRLCALVPRARLYNLYGPTETNVCTFHEVQTIADEATAIPIGRPCDHLRAYVADECGEPVTSEEEGELCIAGPSVTSGYWRDAGATARAFWHRHGSAWYRTGDLVREDAVSGYFFLGRRDGMVKKRGYRIELGEIDVCLHTCPEIREAAVIAVPSNEGVLIHAVVCPRKGTTPSIIALKRFCSERLPLYMVPDRFVFMEALPRTSRGKVDRVRLRELA